MGNAKKRTHVYRMRGFVKLKVYVESNHFQSENLMYVFLILCKKVAKTGQNISLNIKETFVRLYRGGWVGLVKS